MPSPDELMYRRRTLVAALAEVTGVAREVKDRQGDYAPYVAEACRIADRLRQVQMELEEYDVD